MKKTFLGIVILSLIVLIIFWINPVKAQIPTSVSKGQTVKLSFHDLVKEDNIYCVNHGRKLSLC